MAISTYELSLRDVRFPRALKGKHCNFRIVADVRYANGRGDFDTAHAVLPDLERWFECDPDRREDPFYVRGREAGEQVAFDMDAVDAWDRLVVLVRGDGIHSVQLKVYDVDRPDLFDRVSGALADVAGRLTGRGRERIEGGPELLQGVLGGAADDVESALLAKLAGAERLLFRGATGLAEPGEYEIAGRGEHGEYAVRLALNVSG